MNSVPVLMLRLVVTLSCMSCLKAALQIKIIIIIIFNTVHGHMVLIWDVPDCVRVSGLPAFTHM